MYQKIDSNTFQNASIKVCVGLNFSTSNIMKNPGRPKKYSNGVEQLTLKVPIGFKEEFKRHTKGQGLTLVDWIMEKYAQETKSA